MSGPSTERPASPAPRSAEPAVINHDLPCIGCGYNLRTLAPDGRCPECGRGVADSLRSDELRHSDLVWLRRLRRASTILWNACAAGLLAISFLVIVAVTGLTDPSWGIFLSTLVLCALIYFAGLCGALLFLTPETGLRAGPASRTRAFARSSVIGCGVLSLAHLLAAITGLLGITALLALVIAHVVFLELAIGAGAWYSRQLAQRAGMPRLVNAAAAVFVTALAVCIDAIVLLIAGSTPPTRGRGGGHVNILAMVLPVLVLAALISGLVFCTRFNIVLSTIIRHRENPKSPIPREC